MKKKSEIILGYVNIGLAIFACVFTLIFAGFYYSDLTQNHPLLWGMSALQNTIKAFGFKANISISES